MIFGGAIFISLCAGSIALLSVACTIILIASIVLISKKIKLAQA
jgi:hypothetical protein